MLASSHRNLKSVLLLLAVVVLGREARGVPVELQLVAHDRPEVTVDKLEKSRPIVNPVSTPSGVVMRRIGVEVTCWARNVLLNGQPVFERYHEGKYIDRLPRVRKDLAPGTYTLWPGSHGFTVAQDGTVATESQELLISKPENEPVLVRIKCYPVTLRACQVRLEEPEKRSSMQAAPLPDLTLRESGNVEEARKSVEEKAKTIVPVLDLLPVFDDFAPLTVWLPVNQAGKGYLVHPVGMTFHLTPDGVTAGAGDGVQVPGIVSRGREIEIPLYAYSASGEPGVQAILSGLEKLAWRAQETDVTKRVTCYPRSRPYEVSLGPEGPTVSIDPDLAKLPVKAIHIQVSDPAQDSARAVLAELSTPHLDAGRAARVRIRVMDSTRAIALAAPVKGMFQGVQKAAQGLSPLTSSLPAAVRDLQAVAALLGGNPNQRSQAREKAQAILEPITRLKAALPSVAAALAEAEMKSVQATEGIGTIFGADAVQKLQEIRTTLTELKSLAGDVGRVADSAEGKVRAIPSAIGTAAGDTPTADAVEKAQAAVTEARTSLEEVQKVLSPLTEKVSALISKEQEPFMAAARKALSSVNPIADAPRFGRMQPYEGGEWTPLTLVAAPDNEADIQVPNLPAGLYRIQLGAQPEGRPYRPLSVDQWVTLTPKTNLSLGVFTPRGRRSFYRGEPFWIGVGALAPNVPLGTGSSLHVSLVDASGKRVDLVRETVNREVRQQETFIVRLDADVSWGLSAGSYRIEASLGGVSARPITIDLADAEPRTHFTNLLCGKYNVFGSLYEQSIKSGKDADGLVRAMASAGYNAFQGMSYDMHRVYRRDTEVEHLARSRPELGPWESYYQPSGRDRFLDACVRYNVRFYEDMFTYNDTSLPRDPRILDACERYVSLEAASMRHSPALRGLCLYDEIYTRSLIDPSAIVDLFEKAQEIRFREKHGGMTSGEAMKALDRFAGLPFGQRRREDLEKYLKWPMHEDSYWRLMSERMSQAAKEVVPYAQNFTLMRFWGLNGGNIAMNGTPIDVLGPLDAAACVMYKDGGVGDRPVFAPMQADVMRVREGLPVWTQLHDFSGPGLYGRHLVRQAFLALSQKIEGLTFFTIQFDPRHPYSLDNRDTVVDIARNLTTPYGDLLVSLEKGYRRVAVYYSRRADHLVARKPNSLAHQAEGLWVACLRAGFPADFLYDHQIIAGEGMRYDVIFTPGFTYEDEGSPEILQALQRLANAGKTLAVERSSKLPIEGIARLDSELDEYEDRLGSAFPRYVDFETEMVWDRTEEMTPLVREFLRKRIPPAAEHSLIVGPDWLRKGQAEYLVVANFAPAQVTELYKTLYQAPDQPTLRFPKRPPHAYDMLEMKPIEVRTEGDWMTLQADLRFYPGKIYAFLPARIEQVRLEASPALGAGENLHYRVAVLDAAGQPIDAAFPVQITLLDPAGKLSLEVFRAATPEYRGVYRVPANAPAGTWRLAVRELICGTQAETDLAVAARDVPRARIDTQPVWVRKPSEIHRFLAAQDPLTIALDEDQAWCRPAAERLAAELRQRGREVRLTDVANSIRLPGDYRMDVASPDGTRLWRGNVVEPGLFVDAPLILLGKRGENRLTDALVQRDALSDPVSDNFPGPGKALVAWTRRAFSNQYDTVTVLANDAEGLQRGAQALIELANPPKATPPETSPVPHLVPDRTAAVAAAPRHGTQPSSYRDSLAREDLVRTIDVDGRTGRLILGTFGFGHNLFCLSAEGKLLWKQFLPRHNVYVARWYDDGRRIVAATGGGCFVFLIDGSNGAILKRFASTEWPYYHWQEGGTNTEVGITLNPALQQILIGGLTGVMAVDYEGRKMWFDDRAEAIVAYPQEASQTEAAEFGCTAVVGNFTLSPDGQKVIVSEMQIIGSTPGEAPGTIASLWQHQPRLIDARTGKVLWVSLDDPARQRGPSGWWVSWPKESPCPMVHTEGLSIPLLDGGRFGTISRAPLPNLHGNGLLRKDTRSLARSDASGRTLWETRDDPVWIEHLDRMNQDQTRFYRCTPEGLVRAFSLENGKVLWENRLPHSAELLPVGDELVAAANDGTVTRFSALGQPAWTVRIRDLHEVPGDYSPYLEAAVRRDPDSTREFLPSGEDRPGEYESILRFGVEQLRNGSFEDETGWTVSAGEVPRSSPGHTGNRALSLPPGILVRQALSRRIVPAATYLLEFFYRPASEKSQLVAGALIGREKGDSLTASRFQGQPGTWAFGRVAIKSLTDTTRLEVGFEAEGDTVLVDGVSLRPIRFPSANLLANAELHAIEPTYVKDFRVGYDRIPRKLRERLMGQSHVVSFRQGGTNTAVIYTQEQGFLHNGRLDDIGQWWFFQPDAVGFSAVLAKPAYVSHIVLYLNNAWPDTVYRTMSILANNMETKIPETVALVRGNHRRFVVVHLPKPYLTDSIKVLPGKYRAHTDSLTEVEIYGPLGGLQLGEKAFPSDPDAVPMFMGAPSHVPSQRPADVLGEYEELPPMHVGTPNFASGISVVDQVLTFSDPGGAVRSVRLPAPTDEKRQVTWGPSWPLESVTPTGTPARYANRLFIGSADYKLHAIADNGTRLWTFRTEGRIYSSPVPNGDDVYFGSDDGRITKTDMDSGTLLWEFRSGGKVRSSPALSEGRLYAASWDGFLYCLDAETGEPVWKSPLAPFTRSSPAVAQKRVYIGDEQGRALCFDSATGRELWRHELVGYISGCPVVAADQAIFISESGSAAGIGLDGAVRWKRDLGVRVTGQPSATQTQILVPTHQGVLVLRQADGQPDGRFVPPGSPGTVLASLTYRNFLCLYVGYAGTSFNNPPRTYAGYTGRVVLWAPKIPKPEPKK